MLIRVAVVGPPLGKRVIVVSLRYRHDRVRARKGRIHGSLCFTIELTLKGTSLHCKLYAVQPGPYGDVEDERR